ncbi:MAG: hypothetical protein ACREB6_08435, partial [Rhodospirillales bacterium]
MTIFGRDQDEFRTISGRAGGECPLAPTLSPAGGGEGKAAGRREKSASVGKGQHPVDNRSTSGRQSVDMPVDNRSTRGPNAGGENDDRNDDRRRRNDDFRRPMTTNDDLRRKKFGPTRGGARTWPESGGQTGRPADDRRTTCGRPDDDPRTTAKKSRRKPTAADIQKNSPAGRTARDRRLGRQRAHSTIACSSTSAP